MYMECHTVSHARTQLQGDPSVNNAINFTLARESLLNTKKCTTKEAEASYDWALHQNTVQGEIPEFTGERAATLEHNFNTKVRNTLKCHLQSTRDTV